MNITIEVNSRTIEARKSDTILMALQRNGIKVPTLCNMKDLSPTGACRLCVVEVEGTDRLVTSCSHRVEPGMKIKTHSPRVIQARKTLVELLLANHPDDCLYCERNGDCELQRIAAELNIRERRVRQQPFMKKLDLSSPSIVRDPAKCILCGRCIRVCDENQSVATFDFIRRGADMYVGTALSRDLNFSNCIGCGQCVLVCPTGALRERSNLDEIIDSVNSSGMVPVVQLAPSISVSIASELGMKVGKDMNGLLYAALRKIGFRYVFDSASAADVAVMEMAAQLIARKADENSPPMLSSCCPAWVKFMEQYYPEQLSWLSSVKSPQQIMGTLIKAYFAKSADIDPAAVYSVSVMPCLAKKFEARREEMTSRGVSDVDTVISTRELLKLINLYGIDIANIDSQHADEPFHLRSSAGKMFGVAGGTTEALVRTVYNMVTGKDLRALKIAELRSLGGTKRFTFKADKLKFTFLVVSGLQEIRTIMEGLISGELTADYVEVMACPGGCINGGGQPFARNDRDIRLRARTLYEIDEAENIKCAHRNPVVAQLYAELLREPGSDISRKLLHTTFAERNVLL